MGLGELGIGVRGSGVGGPPWILGERGAPRSAPENTLGGASAALDLGLDGIASDLRSVASGELVVLADPTLERTADHGGLARAMTLPELFSFDVGAPFAVRFAGERVPLLEELLTLAPPRPQMRPMHLLWLREDHLLERLAEVQRGFARSLSLRVASPWPQACVRARELGLEPVLVVEEWSRRTQAWLERERPTGCVAPLSVWRALAAQGKSVPVERWASWVDDPEDLLEACRLGLFGLTTTEGECALAARALHHLLPAQGLRWPLLAGPLEVGSLAAAREPPAWVGNWIVRAHVHDPLPFRVQAALTLATRRGTFEVGELPPPFELSPGAERELVFELHGGSFSPGGDPRLVLELSWQRGPGRPSERLRFERELARVRRVQLSESPLRLELLRERRSDPPAALVAQRNGAELLLSIESSAGLERAELVCWLDGRLQRAPRGLRARLPSDLGQRPGGVPFSAAICGFDPSRRGSPLTWRRLCGGLPRGVESGAPGRLEAATA
jgi:hypothetical protein